eukprot:3197513-Pyramimonas_sp.AAC.1
MGTFADRASEAGCLVSTIDARAPWKNAKTERAGGHFKAIYAKACELEPPETRKEAEALVLACEAAKNRFVNRSGVTPVQR